MRLIDADAYAMEMKTRQDACRELIYAAEAECNEEMYDRNSAKFGIFVEAKLTLDAMPTIDAVPVVHGEWKDHILDCSNHTIKYCSECNAWLPYSVVGWKPNYCPNCGAKMNMKKGKQE